MKLVFEKSELVKGVSIVQKAVSVRTTMNILECILIDASASSIFLTGNDLDLGIQTEVPGEIVEKGRVAIDAKLFSEYVKKLPEGQIVVETTKDNLCIISHGDNSCEIQGMSADEFSYIPEVEKVNRLTISQFQLKELINQTIFSLALNDLNPMMTGELFELMNKELRVIGLDSHRIALRKLRIEDKNDEVYAVIPGKSLKEIAGILSSENDDMVNIYFTEKHALFEFDNTKVVSRLIEGKYFNVNQMFSTDSSTRVKVNRTELIDSIERTMIFIKESDKRPVIFDIADNTMRIFVKSTKGRGMEFLNVEMEGTNLKIGFNPKFLLDALKVIDDEIITLSFVNSKSPCFIKDEEDTYLYLILPVNFTED